MEIRPLARKNQWGRSRWHYWTSHLVCDINLKTYTWLALSQGQKNQLLTTSIIFYAQWSTLSCHCGKPGRFSMLKGDVWGLSLQSQSMIYQLLANSQDARDPLQIRCADFAGRKVTDHQLQLWHMETTYVRGTQSSCRRMEKCRNKVRTWYNLRNME